MGAQTVERVHKSVVGAHLHLPLAAGQGPHAADELGKVHVHAARLAAQAAFQARPDGVVVRQFPIQAIHALDDQAPGVEGGEAGRHWADARALATLYTTVGVGGVEGVPEHPHTFLRSLGGIGRSKGDGHILVGGAGHVDDRLLQGFSLERVGAQLFHLRRELLHRPGEEGPLGGGHPLKMDPFAAKAHHLGHLDGGLHSLLAAPVTEGVVAVPWVTPGDEDPISTHLQGAQYEGGVHPAGAHEPDHPDGCGVLHTGDAREVGPCVRAPIAGEGNDEGLPTLGDLAFHVPPLADTTTGHRTSPPERRAASTAPTWSSRK